MDSVEEKSVMHARAYQVEMFELSLKQNIIVAMDTGSGKTHVAVLRIQAELNKDSDKIAWFLAPTLALCEQQYRVLKSQLGAPQIKLLSGADNVDTWSDNRIWNDYLRDVRVVVSPYQILLDAITHAFVHIGRLGLIVFDEAHNCVGKHPGSKIMERYRVQKCNGLACPAILGLTASPIMRSNLDGIEKIEQTLDAVCKSPTLHREELVAAVKRPTLSCVTVPERGSHPFIDSMANLAAAFRSLNIYEDPYILHLQNSRTTKSAYKLKRALEKRETPALKQIQSLYRKGAEMHQQLGLWGSEYFIYRAITHFIESNDQDLTWFETQAAVEKQYIITILQKIRVKIPRPFKDTDRLDLSEKFIALVKELDSAPDNTRCIIFVIETATVAVLAQMLSATASVSCRFQVGTMIGTSNFAARKRELGDLNQTKGNSDLEDFRTGKLNLLIATSIAEEGIDVPACNLVICFNPPSNVKSFIQRRGRARMENSKIILLVDESNDQHDTWMALEDMMKKRYEDDMRVAHELAALEELDTIPEIAPLRITSTGAQLDFDQAKSHLEHFCQKLTYRQHVDHRPFYIAEEIDGFADGIPRIKATVHLPSSLPQAVRRVQGLRQWYSEKNAFKDAAFQAFKAVYEAGLVNDNLMPLIDDILEGIESRSPVMQVNALWNPWQRVAQQWQESNDCVQRELVLKDGNRVMAKFEASLPCGFPRLSPFTIFWDATNTWTVETSEQSGHIKAGALGGDQSAALIDLAYGHRWPVEDSAHILHLQSTENIAFRQYIGNRALEHGVPDPRFLIRGTNWKPHIFLELLPSKPPKEMVKSIEKEARDEPEDVPWLGLKGWPRRQDLLHPVIDSPVPDGRYPCALPLSQCTLDTIDHTKSYFGAIIPSIVHILEIHLTAEELCRAVLGGIEFSDISLVVTAISSRAAKESTDYERLEFLGDSVLKTLASLSVMIQYPNYPEGYLSAMKDRIVSNSRLCRASVDVGLDRFILTKAFTGVKWRPIYIKDILSRDKNLLAGRELSTKTLADVVESLIGAAYIDGGIPKVLACLRLFIPEVEWHDFEDAHVILASRKDAMAQLTSAHEPVEKLIGHTFENKAILMESLTHSSWGLGTSDACMERLEFLGDSILDSIVVAALWPHEPNLTNNEMHLLKTACVNADLLGFLVMEWFSTQDVTEISPVDRTTIITQKEVPLWKYMRHMSSQVARSQQKAEERHGQEREGILFLMAHGTEYPWAQLAHMDIPKFFSDMFESLIGAVWVDSGSMDKCQEIVERVGILPYLRRILSDHVKVAHPKNKLSELVGKEDKRVKYETEVCIEAGIKDLRCRVFVAEQFIVEVGGGVNPVEIVTRAADEAYHLLLDRASNLDDEMTG
ncbi:RNase3 domain-containing protein [Nemania sp. FL0916]|nr:RNase3 domain-containing protein [Nemania sp. FL0916]